MNFGKVLSFTVLPLLLASCSSGGSFSSHRSSETKPDSSSLSGYAISETAESLPTDYTPEETSDPEDSLSDGSTKEPVSSESPHPETVLLTFRQYTIYFYEGAHHKAGNILAEAMMERDYGHVWTEEDREECDNLLWTSGIQRVNWAEEEPGGYYSLIGPFFDDESFSGLKIGYQFFADTNFVFDWA